MYTARVFEYVEDGDHIASSSIFTRSVWVAASLVVELQDVISIRAKRSRAHSSSASVTPLSNPSDVPDRTRIRPERPEFRIRHE